MAIPADLSLQHLQTELSRIDVMIRREVRRWQLAGQDPGDPYRGLVVSDAQANSLLQQPFGASWGKSVRLHGQEANAFEAALADASRQSQALADAADSAGHPLRLKRLAPAFGLDAFALDVFLICLAPALDVRYERLYGYLQDDITRRHPTVNLVLNLLCEAGPERLAHLEQFAHDAPLFKSRLLDFVVEAEAPSISLLGRGLKPDETIVAWLLGDYRPGAEFGAHAALEWPRPDAWDELLTAPMQPDLNGVADGAPVIIFSGPDRAAQHAAARRLASRAGQPLLTVDLAAVIAEQVPPARALQLALRDARLISAVPYLTGWDACLVYGVPPATMLLDLFSHPGLVIVGGQAAWQLAGVSRDRQALRIQFPLPDSSQRQALWQRILQAASPANTPDTHALAAQFLLTTDQIRDAVASARDLAAQRGGAVTQQDLFAAARAHSSPSLAGLAHKITPRYQWPDLVLPDDQLQILREIVETVRGRAVVLEAWGVGQKLASSAGVTVLFSGEPGTGKTMAAEVVAAELGLDLYRIDLSTIVSKYIGETEKNLERIFSEAQSSNAILFFDEADAIFGKRSEVKDAHDRYANIEVSYLLQRMEAYDGVTILATNLRANLDEAFTRRLQFAVDFPFPDATYRLRIWETLFPPQVPRAADLDLGLLARRFKLAGGSIRNIIVSAAFLAAADGGRVSMRHLLHGARRELQKMGRLVKEQDLTAD